MFKYMNCFLPWFFTGTVKEEFQSKCWKCVCFLCWRTKDVNGEIHVYFFWLAYFSLVPANRLPSGRTLEQNTCTNTWWELGKDQRKPFMFVSFSVRKSKVLFWGEKRGLQYGRWYYFLHCETSPLVLSYSICLMSHWECETGSVVVKCKTVIQDPKRLKVLYCHVHIHVAKFILCI